jgi:hypothetical protein
VGPAKEKLIECVNAKQEASQNERVPSLASLPRIMGGELRILFVPCSGCVLPHLIPLMALESRLEAGRHETAFLAPLPFHRTLRSKNRRVLDIDYQLDHPFRSEMLAHGRFRPDVVVDDFSLTAFMTTKLANKPRITIRRTGTFPGTPPRSDNYRHSAYRLDVDFEKLFRNSDALLGVRPPQSIVELCDADINIVPGVSSIEVLPAPVRVDPTYVFSGDLILADSDVPSDAIVDAEGLLCFFERNHSRRIVYLTLGTVMKASESVREVMRYILDCGAALVSSIDLPDVKPSRREMFIHEPFLPMNTVCSNVHLMIHHCGSGTYQYAIRHRLPSICIGSRCYDRDDVASRLEQLGVAKYIFDTDYGQGLSEMFRKIFHDCIDDASDWYKAAKEGLGILNSENDRTATTFRFDTVLDRVVSMHRWE